MWWMKYCIYIESCLYLGKFCKGRGKDIVYRVYDELRVVDGVRSFVYVCWFFGGCYWNGILWE